MQDGSLPEAEDGLCDHAGPAFAAAANAALNTTLNPPFSPYANDLFFLHGE